MDKTAQLGPYTAKNVTKISGNFEVTVEKSDDSSHVPPAPCGCGGSSLADGFVEGLNAAMPTIMDMLQKIVRNTAPTPTSETFDPPEGASDPDKH